MSRTAVTVANSVSVALISPSVAKTVVLPQCVPGKSLFIADSTGQATTNPIWISTSGVGVSLTGVALGPGGLPEINRAFGSISLVAGNGGNTWYCLTNNSGNIDATSISTVRANVGTLQVTDLTVTGTTNLLASIPFYSFAIRATYTWSGPAWSPQYPEMSQIYNSSTTMGSFDIATSRFRILEPGLYNFSFYTGCQFTEYVDSIAWVEIWDTTGTSLVIRSPAAASTEYGAAGIQWVFQVSANQYVRFGFASAQPLTMSAALQRYTGWTVIKMSA